MVPYRGRLALRIARLVLAVVCAAWYFRGGFNPAFIVAVLAAYVVYAAGALLEMRHETPIRATISTVADILYFAFWAWLAPDNWQAPLICGYLLSNSVLMLDWVRAIGTAAIAVIIAALVPSTGPEALTM